MADTDAPLAQAPPIVALPPEPQGIQILGARGGDGNAYLIMGISTEHGVHSVRLPIERAEGVIKAMQSAITAATTGLTIVESRDKVAQLFGK